ncbi:MAG: hypothetical protein ACI9R3_005045 [Verrucomicrobiales bacterium]|jgi:hypothetical protein
MSKFGKSKSSRLSNRQLSAYAALGSFAAGVAGADGAVILNSGSVTQSTVGDETTWAIDLNGDLAVDLNILLDADAGFTYTPGNTFPVLQATGGSIAAVFINFPGYGVYRYAQKFNSSVTFGASIGNNIYTSAWVTQPAKLRDGYGFVNSRWGGNQNGSGFVGVRFKIGADTHYGFVEVSINDPYIDDGGGWPGSGTNAAVIGAYGFESVANTDVHVTAVPEPSSLGLLALGASGLTLMRRRRKATSTAS